MTHAHASAGTFFPRSLLRVFEAAPDIAHVVRFSGRSGIRASRGRARVAQNESIRAGVSRIEMLRDLRFRRPSVVGMNSTTNLVARLAVDLMRTHSATCC
jgi:hypothetical protein